MSRTIRRQHRAIRDDIGDLHTWRPLPNRDLDQIDPFLFLNHHGPQVYPPNNRGLPFGPHPHRGFETVTFIVEGVLTHRDTGGHESVIEAGGVQWMTAGSGLEHAEVSPPEFLEKGGPLEILQLWVNLPSRLKMTEPRYVGLQRSDIPTFQTDGAEVHLIAGTSNGRRGPIDSITDVHMLTANLAPGARTRFDAPHDRNVFFYLVRGEISVSGERARAFHLLEMNDDGDAIELESHADSLVILGHAQALREPVVAHGPFVMNTRAEIIQAIRDYEAGKFRGKVRI